MRFKHSVSITIDNFIDVLKLLLYRLASGVVFFSICYVILSLGLSTITGSAELRTLRVEIFDLIRAMFTGETATLTSARESFHAALKDFFLLIGNHSGSIVGCIVGIGLLYLLSRFVNGLAIFALGGAVNDRMSTFARTRFSQAYFRKLGSAALYQLIYVPISFVYDALSLLACWFFFFYAPSFLPAWGFLTMVLAVALTVTAIVCLQALKLTFISAWMPAVLADGLSVSVAFRASMKNFKDFGGRFVGFLVAVYCVVGINVFAAVFTMGSALLITVPLSYVFFLSMQFVNYYRASGKKYFISRDTIEESEVGSENSDI